MGSPAPAVLAFVAVVLVILPLPWHYRTKNVATLSIAFWLVQGNLFQAINAIAWMDNVKVKYLVYCNIGSAFQTAGIFGLVSASLCTVRNLERIASPHTSRGGVGNERREKMIDFALCIALPLIYTALQYIVAPNQLNIYEVVGCQLPVFISWPGLVLYNLPPLIMTVTTFTYAFLAIKWLQLRRNSIGKVLRNSHASMPLLQFIRLMALAVIITSLSLGLGLYQLYSFTALETFLPWISWNNVHHNFSDVGQFPLIIIPQDRLPAMWAFWSAQPVSALVFFLLFGPTAQALNDIATAWRWVKKRTGRLTRRGNNRPEGAQTIISFTSPSMGTHSVSAPNVGIAQSKSTVSPGARCANGDDLDIDEGDDDSVASSINPNTVFRAVPPLSTKTSPSVPVTVSFPRRHSLVGEITPSPTTPEESFRTEPPIPIALRPIEAGARILPGRDRRNFI